ncbi:hypothetical protein D9M71_717260 [compost metagenome]
MPTYSDLPKLSELDLATLEANNEIDYSLGRPRLISHRMQTVTKKEIRKVPVPSYRGDTYFIFYVQKPAKVIKADIKSIKERVEAEYVERIEKKNAEIVERQVQLMIDAELRKKQQEELDAKNAEYARIRAEVLEALKVYAA